MALLLNKDPDAYDRERHRFMGELKRFHEGKGTAFKKIPAVEGKEIDLYLLYWLVTAQGGWEKVNRNDDWDDLLTSFGVDEATANGSLVLKQTYLRYLDPYEKVHFHGEEDDTANDEWADAEDSRMSRHRKKKVESTVPSTYNYNQHNVAAKDRAVYGLSTNIYKRTDYDRLTLSLTSPLPNEQDFAINVCTLLSNEGRHTLKLTKCPRLLDLLLGHAGVFNHSNLQEYFNGLYKDARQYDLVAFWKDVCRDFAVKELLLSSQLPTGNGAGYRKSRKSDPTEHSLALSGSERLGALMKRVGEEIDKRDESGIFSSGRKGGTHELAGQRVLQIATIIRNLSFEEDNVPVLAKNLTCLRFCLLCASSEWCNLNQMGFDILSNVASDIIIEETASDTCVNEVLLSTLTASISSDDRFQVISSLDILNKLCMLEANEDKIESVLSERTSRVYDQLVNYLSLHDIHLLISTLECLYSLSSLGESACNSIVRTHGAVEALVSLVSVEAQSYGPKACILMRVVETVPGASAAAASSSAATSTVTSQSQVQQQQAAQPQLQQLRTVTTSAPVITSASAPALTAQSSQPQQQQMVRGQIVQIQRPQQQPPTLGGVQLPQNPLPPQQQRNVMPRLQAPVQQQPQQPQQLSQQPQQQVVQQHQQQQIIQPQQQQPGQPQQPQQMTKQMIVTTMANGQPQQVIIAGTNQQITLNKGMVIATTASVPTQGQPQQQTIQLQSSQQPQNQQQQQQIVRSQPQTTTIQLQAPQQQQQQQQPVQSQPQQQQQQQQQVIQQRPQTPNAQQQVQLRVSNDEANRQFCLSWLKATYETVSYKVSIEQQVMYKQYLASLHKLGKKDVISAQHYAVCVRTLFGGSVGPNRKQMPDGSVQYHYDGIQVRKVPLPLRVPLQAQQPQQQNQNQNQPQTIIKTILPVNNGGQKQPLPNNNQVQLQPGQRVVTVPVTQTLVTSTTPGSPQAPPGSPILTHLLHRQNEVAPSIDPKRDEINGGGPVTILDGILNSPKKEAAAITSAAEKSGLLASMLQEKKEQQHLVNGHEQHEQYKKMNGNGKRPASTEPEMAGNEAKRPMMSQDASANGVITNSHLQQIIAPEGSSISTTAGGQKVITTPDGKQMIVKVAANGQQMVVGTIEAASPGNANSSPQISPQPLLNGQVNGNGNGNGMASPTSPSASSTTSTTSMASTSPTSAAASATAAAASATTSSLTVTSVTPMPKPNPNLPFLCEWQGCMKPFKTPKDVEKHAIATHCPLGADDIPCLWQRCDAMKRKRFSLMTHLQDRHCHPQLMKLMAVRRVQMATSGKSDVPLPPAPPPHPGYAPNAALHAIKRHALEFVSPKAAAMGDEKEGPVTKSIRLTSSLILKNLVIYSNLGKKRLRSFESHLSTIALSNVESSRTVSQILYELSDQETNK